MNGASGESINEQLNKLEEKKKQLENALSFEKEKENLLCNKEKIQDFFNKYMDANLSDPTLRDEIIEYYVDAIILFFFCVVTSSHVRILLSLVAIYS